MPDELDDSREAAADLLLFVSLLEESKRWRNSPLRGHQARRLLVVLAHAALQD